MNNYGIGWSMASNTPLKRWKQDTHAGGVRSPLIVRYPGEIADAGGIRRQFHHATDLVPTVLEMLGVDAPEVVKGVDQKPIEGTSFHYSFAEPEASTPKTVQYFEMNGQRALWKDGWKAVTHHEPALEPMLIFTGQAAELTDFDADVWELYHLDSDWNEVNDLAADEPERLEQMVETWWREAEAHDVLPLGAVINGLKGPPRLGRGPRRKS
jgi:arylsulfatase